MKCITMDRSPERQTVESPPAWEPGDAALLRPRRSQFLFTLLLWVARTTAHAESDNASSPPWWPDQIYVANGCFLSASAYLARLKSDHPEVEAMTYTVEIPSCRQHTIVVLDWNGVKYGRDQYLGVFRIGDTDPQTAFVSTLRRWWQVTKRHPYPERKPGSLKERREEVLLAKRIMSFTKTDLVTVTTRAGTVSVLTWETPTGELAIYEPMLGTAVGTTTGSVSEAAVYLLTQLTPSAERARNKRHF